MVHVTRDDGIEILSLPARCYNCLQSAGIDTVGQFLDYPADEWINIRNLGQKSLAEIMNVAEQLKSGEGNFVLIDGGQKPAAEAPIPRQSLVVARRLADVPIEDLNLSVRSYNCLKNAGIRSTAELSSATSVSLSKIKNMGAKSVQEVLSKLESFWIEQKSQCGTSDDPLLEQIEALSDAFVKITMLTKGELIREIAVCQSDDPEADLDELLAALYQRDLIRREVCGGLLRLLEKNEEGMTCHTLLEQMPQGTTETTLEGFLTDLERQETITRQGELVIRRYPTVMDFVESLPVNRDRELFQLRLQGMTLEEIGQAHGLTRERVRQITQKMISKHPRLDEDKYQYLFSHYEFSREEFYLAFGEPPETFNYLEMACPKKSQRLPIKEILADGKISVALRRKAEKAIYKNYVTIDGVRIEKTRPALARYAVQTYCRELTTMEQFMERYGHLLKELGLEDEKSLIIEARTYENKFSASDYALWNQWHSFRYYPIHEREYTPLLEALSLENYEDTELSTLKLFRDHPELMAEYDIRDEYELHNLLRKIWPHDEAHQQVNFKKMPTIEIGAPNRDRQVIELLTQYTPISNIELAEKYEEFYGAKAATALSNYFGCIDCYLHNSVYRMDQPPLTPDRHERMAHLLTEDFYRISEIKCLYLREFPDANRSDINALVLKNLGFRVYSGYVVRNTFSGVMDYFRHLLTDEDIVDLREGARLFSDIRIYWTAVLNLKSRREIIEFSPNQYINIRRLADSGIDLSDLDDYCNAVFQFIGQKKYFTIQSLKQDGFVHELDGLGYDDWFYASLLVEDREHFAYRRMGGTKLFHWGRADVQLADFLRWLIAPQGRMSLYDLNEILKTRYGMTFPLEKVVEVIRSSDLYYDTITATVFIDYDTYFEEI